MKKRLLFAIIALVLVLAVPTSAFSQAKKAASRTDLNLSLVGVVSTLDPFKTALTVDLMLFKQIYESLYYIDD
ncbi:MAG: hypothetical protein RBT73_08680, partial [Spirochaetia bacterium]|nr:hypothetical protein [Spirochaetia bacterium]